MGANTNKIVAKRINLSLADYEAGLARGEKWCTGCKTLHHFKAFGVDPSRKSGLAASCVDFRRVRQLRFRFRPKHGWLKPTRHNDKLQARRRINYLVEQGRIPHPDHLPCVDCGDSSFSRRHRHEYDHYLGYSAEHQLDVEAVCSRCHHDREETRRGKAA